jgi:hypothetical protein
MKRFVCGVDAIPISSDSIFSKGKDDSLTLTLGLIK